MLYALANESNFHAEIDVAKPTINYRDILDFLAGPNPTYHILVSDICITANRSQLIGYSSSIHEDYFKIVFRRDKEIINNDLFSCFNTFRWKVWLTIMGVLLYASILIFIFEYRNIEHKPKHSFLRRICFGIFHTISNILVMNGDVPLRSAVSRLIVLGLYAMGLILTSIYTANLSHFLIVSRTK